MRKVRHGWVGAVRRWWGEYLATVACAMCGEASFRSSPWTRGAPSAGWPRDLLDERADSASPARRGSHPGSVPAATHLQRRGACEPATMPSHSGIGSDK